MKRVAVCLLLMWCGAAAGGPLEDWIEASENPEQLQFWLDDLRASPLDLNRATAREIAALPFIGEATAAHLVSERERRGGFSSRAEAAELDFLDVNQRASLTEFSRAWRRRTSTNRNYLRMAGTLQIVEGEAADFADIGFRTRGRFTGENQVAGFVLGIRRGGDSEIFDEFFGGIMIPPAGYRPRLFAGDYQVESGTGLALASTYGMGTWLSSPEETRLPAPRGVISRPSSDPLASQRGIAAQFTFRRNKLEIFGGRNDLDAASDERGIDRITASVATGALGKARENRLQEKLLGFNLLSEFPQLSLGITGYQARFTPEFRDSESTDLLPRFAGRSLNVGSVYFRAARGNLEAVTEIAGSNPGGIAHQSALTFSESGTSWSLYHVYADADYYSPHSKIWGGFGEDAANSRSTGVRASSGGENFRAVISGSTERTPFRTSSSPLRKSSDDLEVRLFYYPVERVELKLVAGRRRNEMTTAGEAAVMRRTDRARFETLFHGREDYKIRVDLRSAKREGSGDATLGTLAYFQFKTAYHRMNVFTRLTMWDVEDADAAVSVHEQTVYGGFPLFTAYNSGRRASLMLSGGFLGVRASGKLAYASAITDDDTTDTFELAFELTRRW